MSKTVLIIDDNAPTRDLLQEIVTGAGYQPLLAEDGEAALQIAANQDVACALVDQYMEPMNGFNFARQCKAREYKFPLIMVTANEGNDLLVEAQKQGFKTVLVKPIDPAHLIKLLAHVCR